MYDVGAITRQIQTQFRLFCPATVAAQRCVDQTNMATPENVLVLLDELDEVTEAVRAEVTRVGLPPVAMIGWTVSLAAWRDRSARYRELAEAAAPGDRKAIAWDVTAPLLLGLYGGEDSTEPRRPIDAGTPFALANQQQVEDEFRDELWESFLQDLKDNAADIVKPLAMGFGFGALAVGALALVLVLRR